MSGPPDCPRCGRGDEVIPVPGGEAPRVRVLVDHPTPQFVCRTCHERVYLEGDVRAPVDAFRPRTARATTAPLFDG